MSDPYLTFEQYVEMIGEDKDRLYQFVNGGPDETVDTEGGQIPTLAAISKAVSERGGLAVYSDTADGIASTIEGQYFTVPGTGDDYSILYRHDPGGVATEIGSSPSTARVDRVARFEDLSPYLPYVLIETDPDSGAVVRSIRADGEHRLLPVTWDSMSGNTLREIPGVTRVVCNELNNVISYVLLDGSTVIVRDIISPVVQSGGGVEPAPLPDLSVSEMGYTWWIHPLAVSCRNHLFSGAVGNGDQYLANPNGEIRILTQYKRREPVVVDAGNLAWVSPGHQTDDHNAPAILVDPRDDADYPLMVFQTDHAGSGTTRLWRSPTMSPADLVLVGSIPNTASASYSMVYRNPTNLDEIWLFQRRGASGTGLWQVIRSQTNGEPGGWQKVDVFAAPSLYAGTREGSNGIWIAFQTHPLSASDGGLWATELRWDGSLVNPDGSVLAADIWSLSETIDPLTDPNSYQVYQAPTGWTRRLFDTREVNGKLLLLLADFQTPASSYRLTSTYKLVTVPLGPSPSITVDTLGTAGDALEDGGGNAYFAGGCIRSDTDLILARWNAPGEAEIGVMDHWVNGSLGWVSSEIIRSDSKIARPVAIEDVESPAGEQVRTMTPRYQYLTGTYTSYYDFNYSLQMRTQEIA